MYRYYPAESLLLWKMTAGFRASLAPLINSNRMMELFQMGAGRMQIDHLAGTLIS